MHPYIKAIIKGLSFAALFLTGLMLVLTKSDLAGYGFLMMFGSLGMAG